MCAENRKGFSMSFVTQEIEKYPWLTKYVCSENLLKVSVEKVLDYRILPQQIGIKSMISEFIWGVEEDYEEIFLLDAYGEKLLRVGEFQHLSNPVLWRWIKPEVYTYFDTNETIGSAISRVPDEKEVCFVLNISACVLYTL
jgi:hypothetical protein